MVCQEEGSQQIPVEEVLEVNKSLEGKRVRLRYMNDPYSDLIRGDEGVILFEDDVGTIHVAWDNGSRLGLVKGQDVFEILKGE